MSKKDPLASLKEAEARIIKLDKKLKHMNEKEMGHEHKAHKEEKHKIPKAPKLPPKKKGEKVDKITYLLVDKKINALRNDKKLLTSERNSLCANVSKDIDAKKKILSKEIEELSKITQKYKRQHKK
jgi:hypothetical protein